MPEVCKHAHTPGFELRGSRILVLIDHVLVQALFHQLANFGLYPCLAESSQVLPRVLVQQEFIVYKLVGCRALDSLLRKPIPGGRLRQEARSGLATPSSVLRAVVMLAIAAPENPALANIFLFASAQPDTARVDCEN